jgi:hypothetical protein
MHDVSSSIQQYMRLRLTVWAAPCLCYMYRYCLLPLRLVGSCWKKCLSAFVYLQGHW